LRYEECSIALEDLKTEQVRIGPIESHFEPELKLMTPQEKNTAPSDAAKPEKAAKITGRLTVSF